MGLYRDQGVVLRTWRLGETDRIVSLLSLGRGKLRAVAKGVRKPGSRFGARLEPTGHVALQCYEGRTLDTITQVESIDSFRHLRDHLDSLTAAIAMLEVTDQVALEAEPNGHLYRMLVGALRTLDASPSSVVAPAYFWKLLSSEGFHPQLHECVRCGRSDDLVLLVPEAGGANCGSCAPQRPGPEAADALDMVRRILEGGLKAVLAEGGGPVVREVEHLALRAVQYHFERPLRSAAILTAR